jgi:hypothetical protein
MNCQTGNPAIQPSPSAGLPAHLRHNARAPAKALRGSGVPAACPGRGPSHSPTPQDPFDTSHLGPAPGLAPARCALWPRLPARRASPKPGEIGPPRRGPRRSERRKPLPRRGPSRRSERREPLARRGPSRRSERREPLPRRGPSRRSERREPLPRRGPGRRSERRKPLARRARAAGQRGASRCPGGARAAAQTGAGQCAAGGPVHGSPRHRFIAGRLTVYIGRAAHLP